MEVEREKGGVRWEGILRREIVRVLLAEANDSTREIVGALLRKCGYTVVSVSDGAKAWQALKEIRQEVDLVLMEVELPLVSGFELLTMIMEDETFKHIPVIMMSSHDSISMVFKFMLKGAADFLVKPLRKNELRNLWQHVWRRYSLNGDSGEPNARKEYRSACLKSEADSENDADSNYCGGYLACAERNRECSEKGSDTQSSCTLSAMDTEGAHEQSKNHLNEVQLKCIFRHAVDDFEREKGSDQKEFLTTAGHNAFGNGAVETKVEIFHQIKPCIVTPDLLGAVDMPIVSHDIKTGSTAAVKSSDDSGVFIQISDSMSTHSSLPELKLSLKIHESSNYTSLANDRLSILNHSTLSAFSRYNSKSMLSSPPASIDLPEEKGGSFYKIQQPKEPNSHDECSLDGNSAVQFKDKAFNFNAEDTSSTLTTTSNQEEKEVQHQNPRIAPYIISTNLSTTFSNPLESTVSPQLGAPPWIFDTTFVKVVPYLFSQQSTVEVDNSEQSHRFHDQSVRKEKHDVQKPTRTAEAVNGSSCLDQSDSGIMHGDHTKCIDGMLGSNCNGINDNLGEDFANSTEESLSLGGFLPVSGIDAQYQRSIHREMALNKFRLKRKERCFEKKVRYESRKKLAEQRPRVKGQFVRQVQQPNPVSMQVNSHVDDL